MKKELLGLYALPFESLLEEARKVHEKHHNANEVTLFSALNVKAGGCPEDCAFCPQSAHYATGVTRTNLIDVKEAVAFAYKMKSLGCLKLCLGAAWRAVPKGDLFEEILELVRSVSATGVKPCLSMGMLDIWQAEALRDSGAYEYNLNLDTSRRYYSNIIKTRTYDERYESMRNIQRGGLRLSSGGIIGMGETIEDRIDLLDELGRLDEPPATVILNLLLQIEGTPLAKAPEIPEEEFIRMAALARIRMPKADLALSAGRKKLSKVGQSLCFRAGVNGIYTGPKILTVPNPTVEEDKVMLSELGIRIAV